MFLSFSIIYFFFYFLAISNSLEITGEFSLLDFIPLKPSITSCKTYGLYFDSTQHLCLSCPTGTVVSDDGYSCQCPLGSINVYGSCSGVSFFSLFIIKF